MHAHHRVFWGLALAAATLIFVTDEGLVTHEGAASNNQQLGLALSPKAVAVPSGSLSAKPTNGDGVVGALFSSGDTEHACTASVITSTSQNLIITAAHCVDGSGSGMTFVPGYDDGSAPFGHWQISAAFATSAWQGSQPPTDDIAILRVEPRTINGKTRQLQQVTGGLPVSSAPPSGTIVTVKSYNRGSDDKPIVCNNAVKSYKYNGVSFPQFDCDGYVTGSSGSPWLMTAKSTEHIVGILGGPDEGGCDSSTSYSSPLGTQVQQLITRAESTTAGVNVATAPSPDCS